MRGEEGAADKCLSPCFNSKFLCCPIKKGECIEDLPKWQLKKGKKKRWHADVLLKNQFKKVKITL